MWTRTIDRVIEQEWITQAADGLADAVKNAYASGGEGARRLKSALNGVWLGHPLHATITDVPLGSWTLAAVLDVAALMGGNEGLENAATAAVGVGLAGAVAAAAAGATDWSDTDGRARRIGLVHGLLNLGAAGLYAISFALRRRDAHAGGRVVGLLGFCTALASAYLGGTLVYEEQIGVDHAAGQTGPEKFTAAMPAGDLEDGAMKKVDVDGTRVLLVREGSTVRAFA